MLGVTKRWWHPLLASMAAAAALGAAGCGTTVNLQSPNATVAGAPAGTASPRIGVPAGPGAVPAASGPAAPGPPSPPSGVSTFGSGPGSGAPGPGAVTLPSALPGAGGARDHSTLTVGIAFINNQQASSMLGANDPRTNAVKAVDEAYVRALNASGGLAGRRLKVVEYEWHSGDGSWSTAAAAACSAFTQDHHVDVVLDEAFGTIGGFRDCIQRAGIFDVTNAGEGDAVSNQNAPLHANPGGMTLDRTYEAVLQQEVANGYLGKHNQLGIIVEGCAENLRAYSRSLLPLVKRLGLAPPKEAEFNCVDSVDGGASQGSAAMGSAILRFRQPPVVDRVMFVSGQESAALLLFGPEASSQSYHPGYLLSSNAQAQLFTSGQPFPSDQLPQLHGVGNEPYGDVSDARPLPADARCLKLLKSAGLSVTSYDDVGQAVFSCGPFLLLDAALQRSQGRSSPQALSAAIASLGTSFAAPGVVAGSTHFTSAQHDGGDLVRAFAYQPPCGCIRYTGPTAHAPS